MPDYDPSARRDALRHFLTRLKLSGVSLRALCKASGVSPGSISNFLGGNKPGRTLTDATYVKLAAGASRILSLQIDPEHLKGAEFYSSIAVVGYVGAGGEIPEYVDDHAKGDGLEHVPRPPGMRGNVVAVRVRGASMLPVYREGDVLFYSSDQRRSPAELIGVECIVRLKDGRTLLKEIRHGSRKGRFTLGSHNWPDIQDVLIEWAVPVRWIDRALPPVSRQAF